MGQPNAWKDNFANAGKNPYVEALNDMMHYFKQQERSAKPRSIENERKERQVAKAARSQYCTKEARPQTHMASLDMR